MSVDQGAPTTINTVIFDYGEVISRPQSPETKRRLEELSGLDPERFWQAYWGMRRDYDRGQSAADYWQAVAREAGAEWTPIQRQHLWSADIAGWLDFDPRSVELLTTLSERNTRLVLLSNAPRDLAAVLRHSPALASFHRLFFSGDLGLVKPDPMIYDHVLEELSAVGEHTLFVDDRRENISSARSQGIHAHHYSGLDDLTHELSKLSLL